MINGKLDILEQLNLLRDKGIVIEDMKASTSFFVANNYYSVMKLRELLYERDSSNEPISHKYRKGIHINELILAYEENQKLYYQLYGRLMKPILYYKNRYIDVWIDLYGSYKQDSYMKNTNYICSEAITIIAAILEREKIEQYQYEHDFVPIWIVIDAMSEIEFLKFLLYSNNELLNSVFCSKQIQKKRKQIEALIYLYEERTPLLNKMYISDCVEGFCVIPE